MSLPAAPHLELIEATEVSKRNEIPVKLIDQKMNVASSDGYFYMRFPIPLHCNGF
jgi:hypothetical protein